jgi:hypothetical protein
MTKLTSKGVEGLIRQAKAGETVKEFRTDGAGLYLRSENRARQATGSGKRDSRP